MPAFRSRLVAVSATAVGLAIAGAGVAAALSSSPRVGKGHYAGTTSAARFAPCAGQEPHGFRSSRRGANVTLVPSGTDQLLLCRYDGPFGGPGAHIAHRFRLVAQRLIVDHRQVTALADDINRLPPAPGGTADCAKQGDAAIVAFFRYRSGSADPVLVDLTGCTTATNGRLTGVAGAGDGSTLDKLEALVHAEPTSASPTDGARTATIEGRLWLCGGPAPGRCFASTIGGCAPPDGCSRSDRVVAVDAAGEIVAEQRLRYPYPDGKFRLRVSPGQYTVELLADGPRIHDRVMQIQGATARAGHTTTVVFTFAIP